MTPTPEQQRVRELRRRSLRGLPLVGKRRHDAGAAIDELAHQLEQAQARERGLREALEEIESAQVSGDVGGSSCRRTPRSGTDVPDQPAPDFEEARRRAEGIVQQFENPTVPRASGSSASYNDARAYLALLSEREAREDLGEKILRVLPDPDLVPQWGRPDWVVRVRAARSLAALPATESAQAVSDQRAEQAASEEGA